MKKVLFFPLLRMPSGHHQVADTITSYLRKRNPKFICKKIDLLSEWNPVVESLVTKTYLEWIHHFPKTYAWAYKQMAHTSKKQRSYKYYDFLFLNKMKQIISEENPDLIICTHGFPSYFLSRLKMRDQCHAPIINVYTDFFVNDVWGIAGIDYHFVPSQAVKRELLKKDPTSQIFVTGIPISEQFAEQPHLIKRGSGYHVLVSGGSVGLGGMTEILRRQNDNETIKYIVLCGKNKKLYQSIVNLGRSNIHPLPYITSKEKMNELYTKVDAIITKPGGVTISEALKKGLPIFIHSALPGQEEINLSLLKERKLVHELDDEHPLEDQITDYFKDPSLVDQFHYSLQNYLSELEARGPEQISTLINSLLEEKCLKAFRYEIERRKKVQ
ncbi:MGDG synthase family glycosyltransferase [Lederbergia lenta]|uniref:Monogalactosyldiacylglycerol (MGDG) synthase n=1 Tax=Lederbergia lenta TaxID=1467 RepID=A0A2X4VMZ2_LEDLE|nr:glycosyltransferase [Lederbergia lenta]MEC2323731.1 glycosyltransferase [Lederbergia lenta]SQI51549.1 monogalactosyldiacylglycerol (MGDG) synthase [Lederbergia lenta]